MTKLPHEPWVIVLAEGDGRRLEESVARSQRLGGSRKYCRLGRSESLLYSTIGRAERISDQSRIVVVVRAERRRWWADELAQLPSRNVLGEPENRGTAVAILHALVHVLQHDGEPTLVIFPSDHAADDEDVLVESIRNAARLSADRPERFVLLRPTPDRTEAGYGSIQPNRRGTSLPQPVSRSVGGPDDRVAAESFRAGALWNRFICATSALALCQLFMASQPGILRRLLKTGALQANDESERRARMRSLPHVDFGSDVLEPATAHIDVVDVPACGWADLGTPRRLNKWLRRWDKVAPRTSADGATARRASSCTHAD